MGSSGRRDPELQRRIGHVLAQLERLSETIMGSVTADSFSTLRL